MRCIVDWAVVVAVLSCRSRPIPDPPCPPEAVVELLHDAAFNLDQGDDARVRRDLASLRMRLPSHGRAATWALGFADRMERALTSGGGRQFDAETLRADLHMSACLPKELHQRLHQRLPPLPGVNRP